MRETERVSHHLGPQLLPDGPVHKCLQGGEASSTKGFPTDGFSQPMAQLGSLKWSMTSFICPSSPSGQWLLDLSFQHQRHKGHSLGITQVCSLHFLCPGQDCGSHFTYMGLSECETGHVKNGIIDLFPPGWNLWLHSL